MIDFEILKAFGSTSDRLRQIFTAVPNPDAGKNPPSKESKEDRAKRVALEAQNKRDIDYREKFRKRIQSRMEEGIHQGLKNWKKYAAVDMAYETSVISEMTLPLMMYAQGKISVERAMSYLGGPEAACKLPYFSKAKDDKGAETGNYQMDVPRFIETEVNLVRSIVNRRHGAQKVKYGQLYPYYKYEARSTGVVAKCRADVLSQRLDQMTDQFGYREHEAQVMLDGFLYANQLDVVASKWETQKQYRKKDMGGPGDKANIEEVIVKEGVDWFNPHPTRTFWDNAYPLSSLNTDTGCSYFGFWDIFRFSAIDDNPYYFNKDRVGWTGRFWGQGGMYAQYTPYFNHCLYSIIPPLTGEQDVAGANDRKVNVSTYAGLKHDSSVLVANYYEKLTPRDWGFGDYPFPVWVRFVVTQDSTVIFAEIMPSTPAAVLGLMVRDSRQVSVSMAMNLLSYQQQMTNLLTHLLLLCQIQLFKAIGINEDLVNKEQLKKIQAQLKGKNWCSEPLIFSYSLTKLAEVNGMRPEQIKQVIEIAETNQSATIASILDAMLKLVQMVEKLEALSPNEQGQPAPREITATESQEIANTTASVYGSLSADIDSYRAAKKRICYESLVACHQGEIVCPVKDRYTSKTITAAGFSPKKGEDEDYNGGVANGGDQPLRRTVIGSAKALVHDYIFTSRDGAERPVNTQSANTLVQLIGQALAVPQIAQAMGKEKLFELFNEVFRLSGAGVDLNLELKEGESDSLGPDQMQELSQTVEQITQAIQKLAGSVQKNSQDIASQEQLNSDQQEAIKHLSVLAEQVKTIASDNAQEKAKQNGVNKKLIESINYKDAPPGIRRQIEMEAGFTPVSLDEHNAEIGALKEAAKPKPAPASAGKK